MSSKSQDRYDTQLTIKKLPDGRTVYAPAIPRSIQPAIDDIIITTSADNRADIIAQNAFGDASDWWRIIAANGNFDGSIFFNPGIQIIIPKITE